MESKLQIETDEKINASQANVNNEWLIATGLLLAYSLLNIMMPAGAAFLYKWFNPTTQMGDAQSFIAILVTITPIAIFAILAYLYKKMMKEVPFRWSQFKVKDIGIGVLTTIFIVLVNGIISIIGEQFSYASSSDNQETINELGLSFPILIFVATVLIAPVVEEFFYRKLIMGHIFKHYAKTGLVISSILFGLSHFTIESLTANFNPFNILSYVVMGFFFGLVYYITKRIEASIMAHLMNNLMVTVFYLIVM
ncbi:CPBP family intramembrane glutamic endopeptidase [Bacillus benzoevorans]|uniref:CAAX prenyl protease 2/Lysostaphin resistance protein A-like domain-containing protein n=1 Tax=Bacillus benzoevorans TaxID=1456 RepID=A0A7X0LUG7_9BACI|nr:type II CAAX endopeptidase family protein [Bacillus benzoevorans]MBB6444415.1 hypothetical protein [Bacillus benzoevorans]